MSFEFDSELHLSVLAILPNPVLVKDPDLKYVWVNPAFEELFGVTLTDLLGHTDKEIFKDRQAVQCAGGDMRVLESGKIDDATETVFDQRGAAHETITRKSRLTLSNGEVYLVGVMHDITRETRINEELRSSKSLLEQQSSELQKLANTDALTGCINRRALFNEANTLLTEACASWSLLALDLDHFKRINDEHGHDAGDHALVHFADTVRHLVRKQDRFARTGGEEFVLLLMDVTKEEARNIAQRICELVAASPVDYMGTPIDLTVSIGLVLPEDTEDMDLERGMIQADKRLYAAKAQGRNRCVAAA